MAMNLRESIIEIGQPSPLVGVLTEASTPADTALILLNSGIMHRVGSCRLSVRLAREVTGATGVTCLRFDFSGIGDSRPRRNGDGDFDRTAVEEVVEAMDHLQRHRGIKTFILYGLCSGARIACNVAERDPRVVAVAQLDGACYPTRRAYLRYYWRRIWTLAAWKKHLQRWTGLRDDGSDQGSVLTGARAGFEVPEFAQDPGKERIARQLQALMKRDVKLHCVFTGHDTYYCYYSQFRDCFNRVHFGSNLSLDYFPEASHIFTEPLYQARMLEGIVSWLERLLPAAQFVPERAATKAELRELVS